MGDMECIDLTQGRNAWQTLVKAVTNFRFPQNAGNFVTS